MEEKDNLFKFFHIIGEKNMDHVNYKDSVLANLFSQVQLRSELKGKNFITRNLLN